MRCNHAAILLHDESTAALDSRSEEALLSALRGAARAGRTTITIAHRLSTIRHSDTVAVLGEGRVIEVGTFDELYADEGSAFRRLLNQQVQQLQQQQQQQGKGRPEAENAAATVAAESAAAAVVALGVAADGRVEVGAGERRRSQSQLR